MNILISACLLGVRCRYDGGGKAIGRLNELMQKHTLIPVCPEVFGGLPTPREPSEIRGGRVLSRSGRDVTENFRRGADEALGLARLYHCECALLKERSPSCGYGRIYDGSFTGGLCKGEGVCAALLAQNGVVVLGESRVAELL